MVKHLQTNSHYKNKEPELFSYFLHTIVNLINLTFGLYIIFSFLIYIFYHIFGQDLLKNDNYMNYDNALFNNLLNSLLLFIIIAVGFFADKTKSLKLFTIYLSILILINLNYLTNTFELLSNKTCHRIFNYMIIIANFSISTYLVIFYLNSIKYFKYNIAEIPFDKIIHEIKLKTDMMKINFNSLAINLKLHKIFPGLLYKKEDYYFLNSSIEDCDISQILVNSHKADKNNTSGVLGASKSTIDSDTTHIYHEFDENTEKEPLYIS